jgi:hypothetical protein
MPVSDERKSGRTGKTTIIVDGKEYAGVDAMPPEVRRIYEETMGSLRRAGAGGTSSSHVVRGKDDVIITSENTKIIVDGEPVDLSELPPGVREVLERRLAGAPPYSATGSGQPQDHVRSHTVRIVHESRSGGPLHPRRRRRYPVWVNLLILAICAAILALIVLAS